jgi:hypothetical protein
MVTYLDTSDSEFDERSQHLSSSDLVRGTTHGTLDQKTVIMGL